MNQQEEPALHTPSNETRSTGDEATRADEEGDVAEPNAPTDVEENEGMNTILSGETGTGVQEDASDE